LSWLAQHSVFVDTIKVQRALGNLDRITANNGKLTYECVWAQTDNGELWFCVFALNLYDWKQLGRTEFQPARGCVGSYVLPSRQSPANASRARATPIVIPNSDRLDPFAA
jgi:hypothetical protein